MGTKSAILLVAVLVSAVNAQTSGNARIPKRVFGEEQELKRREIKAIRERGDAAVPALVAILLESPDWQRRMLAAQSLAELPASNEVLRAFTRAAFDPDPYVRRDAILGLRKAPGASKEIEAALIKVLETDSVGFIRLQAALSLGSLRPVMPSAVDALGRAVIGTSLEGRIGAANALGDIGPEAKGALPALVRAVGMSEGGTGDSELIDAISRIGETPAEAVPRILRAARETEYDFCEMAAGVIARAGSAALPDLIAASKDDDRYVRMLSALVLKDMPHPKELDPVIAAALRDYEEERALDRIDPDE